MPTPVGHALIGMTVAWAAESVRRMPVGRRRSANLAMTCAALAVIPDLDLIYLPVHRTITHSLAASVLAGAMAGAFMRRTNRNESFQAIVCGLAYGSHLFLDWLGGDTKLPAGIQLLWPFSDRWFISSWGLFRPTDLGRFFSLPTLLSNGTALLRELWLVGPVAIGAYLWRRRGQLARL